MKAFARLGAFAAVLLAISVTVSAARAQAEWTVDLEKSRIEFVGRQMRVPTEGAFERFTATIRFDPDNPQAGSAEVVIDTASARTGNSDIDREMKRPKWFDVERFPTARFVVTAFHAKGDGVYEAIAQLTMRDVTDDVVLPFKLSIAPDPSDSAVLVAHAEGEIRISRTKYGIGRGEWADTSIVADEVTIRIDLLARRAKP